ncbi:MAG: Flp pilus assembly protein CpaB [Rhodospirillales bacterium]|nr:Flp pilus assembly protein CpaB [Rhodospirillales bacterium]
MLLGLLPLIAAVFVARLFLFNEPVPPAQAEAVAAEPAPEPVEVVDSAKVLLAARHLPLGTLLGEEDLDVREVDIAAVRSHHVEVSKRIGPTTLFGHAMRQEVGAGEWLTWSAVVGPGQRGFLAAALRPGMRAVTIQLGKGARHAGLIDPGDRVDVLLTALVAAAPDASPQRVFSRTIIENVRVVAVDRRIEMSVPPGNTTGETVERTEIVTATLEVSPDQANRLVLGEREGSLSLAVRSLAATAAPHDGGTPIGLNEIMALPLPSEGDDAADSKPLDAERIGSERVVRVIRGDEEFNEVFSDFENVTR